jgi:hypothetical protein
VSAASLRIKFANSTTSTELILRLHLKFEDEVELGAAVTAAI